MYVIGIHHKNKLHSYVKDVNYKRDCWESGWNPKVFKSIKSAEKCVKQVLKYATAIELVIYKLEKVKSYD